MDNDSCVASVDTEADGRTSRRTALPKHPLPWAHMTDSARPSRRRRGGPVALILVLVLLGVIAIVGERASDEGPPDPNRLFVFAGRGFGHGVGLSQWGAKKAAEEGRSAEQILQHYYTGVQITEHDPTDVRVKIIEDVAEVGLTHTGRWTVTADDQTTQTETSTMRITRDGADIVATPGDGDPIRSSEPLTFAPATADPIQVDGRGYRGTLQIHPTDRGVDVVNTVPLEQYLRGVVSREMSPAWAPAAREALRAQAIVARTYALANLTPNRDFDLMDDQRSQVYGGVTDEDPRTDAAITATRDRVVTYNGKLITTYYSAASGGHTEDGDRVFPTTTPQPYLAGVPDPYDEDAPLHRWGNLPAFTPNELRERLKVGLPIRSIDILERGASPRVFRARVNLIPFGSVILTGAQIRARLELPDTWFSVIMRETTADGGPIALGDIEDRSRVWVSVLNGGDTSGAAARLAETAEDRGYVGISTGNATTDDAQTVVYAAPGNEFVAQRVADDLGITGNVRSLDDADEISDAPKAANVVVVIGTGDSGAD